MGGMMFSNTEPIRQESVQRTLSDFQRQVLTPVGIKNMVPVGSTGKKSLSGDLDVAVFPPPGMDRKQLASALQALPVLGPDNVRAMGSLVSVSFPVNGENSRVQIDIMFSSSSDLGGIGWLMSGTGDGKVGGTYRNLLLSFVAREASKRWGTKLTVSLPGGVQDPENGGARTEDPQRILDILGINARPDDVLNFESLLQKLREQGWSALLLDPIEGFEAYMSRHLANPSTRSKATFARDTFRSIMGVPPLAENASRRILISAAGLAGMVSKIRSMV